MFRGIILYRAWRARQTNWKQFIICPLNLQWSNWSVKTNYTDESFFKRRAFVDEKAINFVIPTSLIITLSQTSRHLKGIWHLNQNSCRKSDKPPKLDRWKIEKTVLLIARHLRSDVKTSCVLYKSWHLTSPVIGHQAPKHVLNHWSPVTRTWQFSRGFVLLLNSNPIISILPKSRFGSWLSHCFTPRAAPRRALIGPSKHKHVKLALRHAK